MGSVSPPRSVMLMEPLRKLQLQENSCCHQAGRAWGGGEPGNKGSREGTGRGGGKDGKGVKG